MTWTQHYRLQSFIRDCVGPLPVVGLVAGYLCLLSVGVFLILVEYAA